MNTYISGAKQHFVGAVPCAGPRLPGILYVSFAVTQARATLEVAPYEIYINGKFYMVSSGKHKGYITEKCNISHGAAARTGPSPGGCNIQCNNGDDWRKDAPIFPPISEINSL